MKYKFLEFFTGKMSKSVYIAIASAVVCGAVVITSTVIVHNNNQKIDSVLEGLSASESVSESASESVTENVSDTDNINSQPQAKAPNGEPAGDKALQYLAEYEKLKAEYESKRAELEKTKPNRQLLFLMPSRQSSEDPSLQAEYDKEYKEALEEVTQESILADEQYGKELSRYEKQLQDIDSEYEKDVAALKAKYGIE